MEIDPKVNMKSVSSSASQFGDVLTLPRDIHLPASALAGELAIGWLANLRTRLRYQTHLSKIIHTAHRVDSILISKLQCSQDDLTDLLTYEAIGNPSTTPRALIRCIGYLRALDKASASLVHDPVSAFSTLSVQALHRELTQQMAVKGMPGEFRASLVNESVNAPDLVISRRVPPGGGVPLMDDVSDFIRGPVSIPFVVRLALVYGQIEVIQPFEYGSIYIAQILIQMMMQLDSYPQIPLAGIMAHDEKNIRLLLSTLKVSGDWSNWIPAFLAYLDRGARALSVLLEAVHETSKRWQVGLEHVRRDSAAIRIADILLSSPVVTAANIQKLLEISFQTANAGLHTLMEVQILSIVSDGRSTKRNRVFIAQDIIQSLLNYAVDLHTEGLHVRPFPSAAAPSGVCSVS